MGAATLQLRMNPNEFGKKLGIGVRVAGRIAQQRAQQSGPNATSAPGTAQTQRPSAGKDFAAKAQEVRRKAPGLTRAAGRGLGGFLRPFSRVGGILWLEVTGFFFGLFALFFATAAWKTRAGYAQGPDHQRFLIAAIATVVFGYLCVTSFLRARRK
jgi:hypothetical protein